MKKPNNIFSSTQHLKQGSKEYSLYVCENRGIPRVQDGLKTGQRLALWALKDKAESIKVSSLSGLLSYSKLYMHGEVSASNAISLLAAPYRNSCPLIEGIGVFGTRVSPTDGIGAARYISVRRNRASTSFLYNDADLIPLVDNYDGSNSMPEYFLPLIPTVLLNGIKGMAVGYSTDILPRKLSDLIDATCDTLKGKKIKEPQPYYNNYDVEVRQLAPAQWEIYGKIAIRDSSTLVISELPPGLSLEAFKKKLIAMEERDEIVNFFDNSSKTISIEIQMKRGSLKGWTELKAREFFKLSEKVTERLVVVGWNCKSIMTYDTPTQLIQDFVKWRLDWYEKRYQKLDIDTSDELAYWKLLEVLFRNGFTKKLGTFANKTEMENTIRDIAKKAKLPIGDNHVARVVALPTYRWTREFEAEILNKIKELSDLIADYRDILAKPDRRRDIYLSELDALKKIKF